MRSSSRQRTEHPLPVRIKTLFHTGIRSNNQLPKNFELIHSNPNIFLIHNFLTESEINHLDTICTLHGKRFGSSFTEDDDQRKVISEERTSTFLHLSKGQDTYVRRIERKAAELVGLTSQCVEPLQIVSYRDGQKFERHHDAGTLLENGDVSIIYPKRLVTYFVYLNDLPENQGTTEFPSLDLRVQPRRGSALLFCNILPDGTADIRTIHRANPIVGNLVKYGLNIWPSDCDLQEFAQQKPKFAVGSVKSTTKSISAFKRAQDLHSKYCKEVNNTLMYLSNNDDEYWKDCADECETSSTKEVK